MVDSSVIIHFCFVFFFTFLTFFVIKTLTNPTDRFMMIINVHLSPSLHFHTYFSLLSRATGEKKMNTDTLSPDHPERGVGGGDGSSGASLFNTVLSNSYKKN